MHKQFFIFFIVVSIIGIPITAAVDFYAKNRDAYTDFLLKTLNTTPIDVLYFGDSTIRFYASHDKDKRGIDQFFQEKSKLSVCTVANPGFSPIIYRQYVKLLKLTKYKPKLIIIPINLRGFSDSICTRPSVSFPLKQIYINYRYTGKLDWKSYLQYRFLGREDSENDAWFDLPVIRNNRFIGTNRQVLAASRISDFIDYDAAREARYAKQLALKFNYHYMMTITQKHQMLTYLDTTIDEIKQLHIPVLIYFTPINIDDGKKYDGLDFLKRVRANFTIIRNRIERKGVPVLDLSEMLPPADFFHKADVFEHLDTEGRQKVAGKVATAALHILQTNSVAGCLTDAH